MADLPERIQLKTFTVVTAPKSRMSTNSITGAYLLLGNAGTEMERKNLHCGDST